MTTMEHDTEEHKTEKHPAQEAGWKKALVFTSIATVILGVFIALMLLFSSDPEQGRIMAPSGDGGSVEEAYGYALKKDEN